MKKQAENKNKNDGYWLIVLQFYLGVAALVSGVSFYMTTSKPIGGILIAIGAVLALFFAVGMANYLCPFPTDNAE